MTSLSADEQWRSVPGFPGYHASTLGRVRGPRGKILRGADRDGYLRCQITVSGTRRNVAHHSMVAATFIGPRPDRLDIDHLDGDRQNNRPHNLRYCSHAENVSRVAAQPGERNGRAKLTEEMVAIIRESREPQRATASRFGVSPSTIHQIRHGNRWSSKREAHAQPNPLNSIGV